MLQGHQQYHASINAVITLSVKDAYARGYLLRRPTGYHSKNSGAKINGETVAIRVGTGDVVEVG